MGVGIKVSNPIADISAITGSMTIDGVAISSIDGDPNFIGENQSAAPVASADSAIAMGFYARALGIRSVAAGYYSYASGIDSVSIGSSNYATADNSISIGTDTIATAGRCVAIGDAALAKSVGCIAIGDTASAGNTAGSIHCIAIGSYSVANSTDDDCIAIGRNARSEGKGSIAIGGNLIAAYGAEATAGYSIAMGIGSKASVFGQVAFGTGFFVAIGDAQKTTFICRGQTLNATPANINPDGTTTNKMILPIDTAWAFDIRVTVRQDLTGDTAMHKFEGCIKRDGTTNTALVGSVSYTLIAADTGATWTLAVTADDTLEALQIEVTGEAAHTLRWVAVVDITEVSG